MTDGGNVSCFSHVRREGFGIFVDGVFDMPGGSAVGFASFMDGIYDTLERWAISCISQVRRGDVGSLVDRLYGMSGCGGASHVGHVERQRCGIFVDGVFSMPGSSSVAVIFECGAVGHVSQVGC
jgi:hypothetical protein